MKKIVFLSFLGLLVAAGCNKASQNQSSQPAANNQSNNSVASNNSNGSTSVAPNPFDDPKFDINSLPAIATVQSASTAGWKTYSDATYGFQFKYPSDWSVGAKDTDKLGYNVSLEKTGATSSAVDAPDGGISFAVRKQNYTPTNAIDFLKQQVKAGISPQDISGFKVSTQNGYTMYYFNYTSSVSVTTQQRTAYKNGYAYGFGFDFYTDSQTKYSGVSGSTLLGIAQSIVSSFKFTK
jgi:hypothetical protein